MNTTKIKSFNGDRLESARTYRGYNVSQLAEKLGLQRQTVSMYENGKIANPDPEIIEKMSSVLDFPVRFFLQQDNNKLKYESIYFRSLLTTDPKYRKQQKELVKFIAQIYSFLNGYLDFPVTDIPEVDENTDTETMAMILRNHWMLGEKPIGDLAYLAEKKGIIVVNFQTSTNAIDAFSQMINDKDDENSKYLIGYSNNNSTAARIHFDIAHELGHILMHEWSEDIESLTKDEFRKREEQANAFASAFLLPEKAFKKDIGLHAHRIQCYVELKRKWKVSISAMIRRAYNLGLIKHETYQSLNRKMQKDGIKKEEPLDRILTTATPSLLRTAVQMLLKEGVLTAKEFVDELSSDYNLALFPDMLEEVLGLEKGTLQIEGDTPSHKLDFRIYKAPMNQ